jgi:Protein of unknown function (DUF3455)
MQSNTLTIDRLDNSTRRTARSLLAVAIVTAAAPILAVPQLAHAHNDIEVPSMPAVLAVPPGHEAFAVGHAEGSQNYICLPIGNAYAWTFFGPQATLFDDDDKQTSTHFLSTDPFGVNRPTWQHSKDSSLIWGAVVASATSVTEPAYVEAGAIPWLLVSVAAAQEGPTGGHKLSQATYIHRLDTSGGVAPAAGCAGVADIGKKALVPYTTDYYFYRAE